MLHHPHPPTDTASTMTSKQDTHELELKFEFAQDRRDALRQAAMAQGAQPQRLRARYFDTDDGRLAAQQIALRLRLEGSRWIQTVKAPSKHLMARLEDNADVDAPASADDMPAVEVSRHAGTPAGDRLRKALAKGPDGSHGAGRGADDGSARLKPLYGTDIQRLTRLVETPAGRVEIAMDEGVIESAGRSTAVHEVELEWKGGTLDATFDLALEWVRAHGLWMSTQSKGERGERLFKGDARLPVVKAEPPRVDHQMNGEALLRATVQACLNQILPNASAVAGGSTDPDHVHQLRVGIRRLRTALREMAMLSTRIDPQWDGALTATFRALGELRDRQTVLQGLVPVLEAAGAPPIGVAAVAADGDAAGIARASDFQCVLLGLMRFVVVDEASSSATTLGAAAAEVGPAADDEPRKRRKADASKQHGPALLATIARRLDGLHRKVTHGGGRFADLAPEAQHKVRKRLKRLRYLAEFMSPLFEAKAVDRYLDTLEPAQDALGAHNDSEVAIQALSDAPPGDRGAWFGVGWLVANRERHVKASRKTLSVLEKAPRFWEQAL
jgi:triphosphatase